MSDTERVRAWRQRLKDNGLVPLTIWVKAETKAWYEDLALQSHHSPSELAQLALEAYRLDPALVAAPVTDAEQIRALIREELDEAMAIITATVTAIVTDTAKEALPAMVETALQRYVADTTTETETATPQEPSWLATAEAFVSDMATDADTDTAGGESPQEPPAPSVSDTYTATATETTAPSAEVSPDRNAVIAEEPEARHGRPVGRMRQQILALLEDHPEGLTAEQIRAHLSPQQLIGDTLQGMRRSGAVQVVGEGRQRRYTIAP